MSARICIILLAALLIRSFAAAQETIAVADKQLLAKRIEPLGKEAADLLRRPETKVDEFKTPFFARGAIYQATNPAPHRPIVFTFGVALPNFAVMLSRNPEGFMELASKAGVDLSSGESRLAYGRVFLMATRDFAKRFQILRDVSDIELIAQPTDDEKTRYQELTERFKARIQRPRLAEGRSDEAIFYCLIGQGLFETKLKIGKDGRIERSDTLLADDLPIAVAR